MFDTPQTQELMKRLFSAKYADEIHLIACNLKYKEHSSQHHILAACAMLRLNGDHKLADDLLTWYHDWYDTRLVIEHASIRLNRSRGYILLFDNKAKTYEHVLSWKVYPTKKLAYAAIKARSQ